MMMYKKIKFRFVLNIKKGYKKFIKLKGLENFRILKKDLFLVEIYTKKITGDLINIKNIDKSLIQYINQKLFDNYFFYFFLYFYNREKKIIFPIPKEFNEVFKKNSYEVNFLLSNLLWKIFTVYQLFSGIKEILILIYSIFNFKDIKLVQNNYSLYPNLSYTKINLAPTREENNKLFNLVSWCDKKFLNKYSVFLTNQKEFNNDYFKTYKSIEQLFSYKLSIFKTILWAFKVTIISFYWLIFQKNLYLSILPEIIKCGYLKFSKQKLPDHVFFIWTNNHYRPLWTYEVKDEKKIKMIFIGLLNGLIQKGDKELTKNDFEGLSVATWPYYFAWNKEHQKYITDRLKSSAQVYNLNSQVYFKDSIEKLILPKNSISVFGYENNRIILGYSTLADYDTQNKFLLKNFYEEIYDVLINNNFFLVLKRKKKLGNIEIKRFKKFFNDFKKKKYVIFVDEDIAVEKIIASTKATVSMPFTSPGFIAKNMKKNSIFYDPSNWINSSDPSALGLEIINSKNNLRKWISKI